MTTSVFDLFRIGIGPSSSHTVGPMRAAREFACRLDASRYLARLHSIKIDFYGSLALTGPGHGADKAVLLGLRGEIPETVEPDDIEPTMQQIRTQGTLDILGKHRIGFIERECLFFNRREWLPLHPNGMRFNARDREGKALDAMTYYSIGGGFIRDEAAMSRANAGGDATPDVPLPFYSAAELLGLCRARTWPISEVMRENERARRSDTEIADCVLQRWDAMRACVERGCRTDGVLPGGLNVKRRAAALCQSLLERSRAGVADPLAAMDWVNVYAMAVNEENAAGGRVVTAPTNGAAGLIPAVLHYYRRFIPGASDAGIVRFFLTAGAIGALYRENASISGAEVGCQGEVGVACSMAAAGLAELLGGSPEQVENAAEIGMEHNLGLTCDPIGGLVQVPCIERNAVGAVTAINAARMALAGNGAHIVSLDKVIRTMRITGADMKRKYKETSRGGLAVNVVKC